MRSLKLCLLFSLALLAAGVVVIPTRGEAQQTINLEQDETQSTRRTVSQLQERIRLLYSQGQYEAVIEEANVLLELEPNNPTAILNKDNAERRLAQGRTGPPVGEQVPPDVTPVPPEALTGGPIGTTDPGDPFAEVPADPTPAPDSASTEEPVQTPTIPSGGLMMGGGSFSDVSSEEITRVLFGEQGGPRKKRFKPLYFFCYLIGLVAAVGLGAGGVVWFMAKDLPTSQTATVAPSAGRTIGIEDMPTVSGVGDDPATAQPASAPPAKRSRPAAPAPVAPPVVVHDEVTTVEREPIKEHDPEYHQAGDTKPDTVDLNEETDRRPAPAEVAAKDADVVQDDAMNSGLFLVDAFSSEAKEEEPKEDEFASLGLDYEATDDPMLSNSQFLDIYQTEARPMESTKDQPAVPEDPPTRALADMPTGVPDPPTIPLEPAPAAPKAPAPKKQEPEESFLDISAPAPPLTASAPPAEEETNDPAGLSFSSLMFGEDETLPPDQKREPAPAAEDGSEDLTMTSFDQQFSNVMFGSDDDQTNLVNPASAEASPAEAEEDEEQTPPEDVTLVLPGGFPGAAANEETRLEAPRPDPSEEKTTIDFNMPKTAAPARADAPGAPKVSMFDKQKDAGREAMDAGDYARAVQCLSVAASLKPADKEVRAMLEEARKKRRGV